MSTWASSGSERVKMKIRTIRTLKITGAQPIENLLSRYIRKLPENSIVAITSKIVSICEGNVVDVVDTDKEKLIYKEADMFLRGRGKFGALLTIKNNTLIPTAGIDESNGNGKYILWPSDPQKSANKIRSYLKKQHSISHLGVIITDSKTTPLRWGTTGISIAHTGFKALNNYIGQKDLFGRNMICTRANIADGIAAAAVLIMGEGREQTPIAVINDLPFVVFQKNNPTGEELSQMPININDDLYGKILTSVKWQKKRK